MQVPIESSDLVPVFRHVAPYLGHSSICNCIVSGTGHALSDRDSPLLAEDPVDRIDMLTGLSLLLGRLLGFWGGVCWVRLPFIWVSQYGPNNVELDSSHWFISATLSPITTFNNYYKHICMIMHTNMDIPLVVPSGVSMGCIMDILNWRCLGDSFCSWHGEW